MGSAAIHVQGRRGPGRAHQPCAMHQNSERASEQQGHVRRRACIHGRLLVEPPDMSTWEHEARVRRACVRAAWAGNQSSGLALARFG